MGYRTAFNTNIRTRDGQVQDRLDVERHLRLPRYDLAALPAFGNRSLDLVGVPDLDDLAFRDNLNAAWLRLRALFGPIGADYVTGSPQAALTSEIVLGTGAIMAGLAADRPAASLAGRLYYSTDTGVLERDTGAAWVIVAAPTGADYVTGSAQAGLGSELVLGTAVVMTGLEAARPAASLAGRLWYSTDRKTLYRDTGAAWVIVGSGAVRSGALADRPAFGNDGDVWWATDTDQFFIDTGAAWVELGAAAPGTADATTHGRYDRVVDPAGNGTDLTIQAAITALGVGGGTIFVKPGTYIEALTIAVGTTNLHIIGTGPNRSIIQRGAAAVDPCLLFPDAGAAITHCRFENLRFDHQNTAAGVHAVRFLQPSEDITFVNCRFQGGESMVNKAGGVLALRISFLNCLFWEPTPTAGRDAIAVTGAAAIDELQVVGCRFVNCGVNLAYGSGSVINGNHFDLNTTALYPAISDPGSDAAVTGNTIRCATNGAGIRLGTGASHSPWVVVTGNTIDGINAATTYGIQVNGAGTHVITGNFIFQFPIGISVVGGGWGDVISGNGIESCATGMDLTAITASYALNVSGNVIRLATTGIIINRNFQGAFKNNVFEGVTTPLSGVRSTGAVIRDNEVLASASDEAAAAMNDDSPGRRREVKLTWESLDNVATRLAVGGSVALGGSGQCRLRINDNAADIAGVENAADAAGALASSFQAARRPHMKAMFSINAFRATTRIFVGLRATLGGAVPGAENHVGFIWDGTNFLFSHSDGTAPTQRVEATPSTGANHTLEVITPDGTDIYILAYVDEARVDVDFTDLPTGALFWQVLMYSTGAGGATTSDLTLRELSVWEAPS